MKLQQLHETDRKELGIRYRDGKVRVTYGNKGITIYRVDNIDDGLLLTPVSPWSGKPLHFKNWNEAKEEINDLLIHTFRTSDPDARLVGRKLGLW